MGNKRVSVPDFEEIVLTKQINTDPAVFEQPAVEEQTAKPQQAITDIISTMFKTDKKETPSVSNVSEQPMPKKANAIVENLKQIEVMRKLNDEKPEPVASFEIQTEKPEPIVEKNITPIETTEKETPTYEKLEEQLTEEQSIKLVKSLKLWAKEVEFDVAQFPEYPDYFYIARKNTMNKIGNSYVVDKTTGKIYSVPASMPEHLSFKKVKTNSIKPLV